MASSSGGSHHEAGQHSQHVPEEIRRQESRSRETSAVSCSSADCSLSDSPVTPVVPLYNLLHAPTKSTLTRKRATRSNDSSETMDSSENSDCDSSKYKKHRNDPKNVSPAERVNEFKEEPFTVQEGKLFCLACREYVGLKKSIINNHVKLSKKHAEGKRRLNEKNSKEHDIARAFYEYNMIDSEHLVGEHLPEPQQIYRIKVVTAFMRAGIPLSKVELFRDLLEENGYRLGGRRTMFDLIPFIHKEEEKRIRKEVQEKKVSIIFDGTTRCGE